MFAVAVLGIGLIMIAAALPAGLLQTKLSLDETAAASSARAVVARAQQFAATPWAARGGFDVSLMPGTFNAPGYANHFSRPTSSGKLFRGIVRTLNDPRPMLDTLYDDKFTGGIAFGPLYNRVFDQKQPMWMQSAADMINAEDPRRASVLLYKRDHRSVKATNTQVFPLPNTSVFKSEPNAQIIVITAQATNQSTFAKRDIFPPGANASASNINAFYNLEPRPVAVQVVYDQSTSGYVVSFFSVNELTASSNPSSTASPTAVSETTLRGGYPDKVLIGNGDVMSVRQIDYTKVLDAAVDCVAEGAFFVISDDRLPGSAKGQLNGRIFRVGTRRPDLGGLTFDLAPGYSFTPDPGEDGHFNSPSNPSGDDLVGIGISGSIHSAGLCKSGVKWRPGSAPAYPFSPGGPAGANSGPSGYGLLIEGNGGEQGAVALILGRGFAQPGWAPPIDGNTYAGPAMDVAAYTTFIPVPRP